MKNNQSIILNPDFLLQILLFEEEGEVVGESSLLELGFLVYSSNMKEEDIHQMEQVLRNTNNCLDHMIVCSTLNLIFINNK